MTKTYCDCCGKEIVTQYVISVIARSTADALGLTTCEAAAHNVRNVFAPEKTYCYEFKNKALAALEPRKKDA